MLRIDHNAVFHSLNINFYKKNKKSFILDASVAYSEIVISGRDLAHSIRQRRITW